MKRFLFSIILCVCWAIPTNALFGQELEQFRLKTGDEPIQGKPLSWDFQSGVLTLELADGTTRDVAASDLHSSDMRLVERLLSKQLLAGRRGESIPGTVSSKPVGATNAQSDRIQGVRWYDNETEARKIASGKDGSNDDKPLVWFRVLGDMTGFM